MDDTRPTDDTPPIDPSTAGAGEDPGQDGTEDPPEGPVVEETPEDPEALVGAPVAPDVDLHDLGVLADEEA